VIGADGKLGGIVRDLWVDRSEAIFRYLELDVPVGGGTRRVMLPINFSRIGASQVKVASILGYQFSSVPSIRTRTRSPCSKKKRSWPTTAAARCTPAVAQGALVVSKLKAVTSTRVTSTSSRRSSGLPEQLPSGERCCGRARRLEAPGARTLSSARAGRLFRGHPRAACDVCHVGEGSVPRRAHGGRDAAAAGGVRTGIAGRLAWLSARTTVYTITDKRVVMRIGIVLSLTFNLPLRQIESAGLKLHRAATATFR
jgi:hypothetical protein